MFTATGRLLLKKVSHFPVILDRERANEPDDLSFEELRAIFLRLVRFLNFAQISELIGLRCFYLEVVEEMRADCPLLGEEISLALHDFLIRHFPSAIFPDKAERVNYLCLFRNLRTFMLLLPEKAELEGRDGFLQGFTLAFGAYMDHLVDRLGLMVKSCATDPDLWRENVIIAARDHPQLHAPATGLNIDLFPFYVFRDESLHEWRPDGDPFTYYSETGEITSLQDETVRAALLHYHELFLMTSAGRQFTALQNGILETKSLETLETAYSCWRAGDHGATLAALTAYRFIQYQRSHGSLAGRNSTLDYLEASCLLNLGKKEEARTALNRLLRQAPRLFYPYSALISIHEGSGKVGEAERLQNELEQILISNDDISGQKATGETRWRRSPATASANLPPELIDLKHKVSREPLLVVGRQRAVAEIIEILSCMERNNAIIVGNPGAGKTALVHEVVRNLSMDDIPVQLLRAPVWELNVAALFFGISHRDQLDQKLSNIFSLLERAGAILFIDDIHTLFNEGMARSGAPEVSTMLKQILDIKSVRLIAAASTEEYAKKIGSIPLFSRLFQKIDLPELPLNDIVQIMRIRAEDFRRYHQVTIDIEGICRHLDTVRLFFRDRMLPDKAIVLLDRACSHKSLQPRPAGETFPHVDEWDFLRIVADSRGVEISTISATLQEKMKALEATVNQQIIGQPEVITKLARKIVPSMTGLKMKEGRPDGVFLFVGPTGVGKTETARVLAEVLLGSEDKLLRIDMSEYMEEFTVSRLIGAAPGYVGYDDQNQLIDEIRRDPYRIILLDEIEKAHPLLVNIFLQVFDSGILTDAKGRKAYFDKSIIIMTSNLGVSLFSDSTIGFDPDESAGTVTRTAHAKELKRFFKPEFLNRIDEVIFFNPLTPEDAHKIVRLHLERLNDRLKEKGLVIRLSDSAVGYLVRNGFSREHGARELLRIIQDHILQPVAGLRLKHGLAFRNVSVSYLRSRAKLIFRMH
ncbi:MAG: AAA family ATPase [Syntrophobacteraceae bacterium]